MKVIPGVLFAGAIACGLLLRLPAAQAASEKVLYTFCSQSDCADGKTPSSGLTEVKGTLYGETYSGGPDNCSGDCGVVFTLDPKHGAETVLHGFTLTDGYQPSSDLLDVNGILYGTTQIGGPSGGGSVFRLDPQTGAATVLYSFMSQTDGSFPIGRLIDFKGTLYGTTTEGGGFDCFFAACGTVFALDEKSGSKTILYTFTGGADGGDPQGSLLRLGKLLYGTAGRGGPHDAGVVFTIDLRTGAETVLHSFGDTNDGASPTSGLINVNGTLYGTTEDGGAHSGGTVFALDPKTGSESVVYSFCSQANCTDGKSPFAGLINQHGTLYGTTGVGGANNGGTVFSLDPQSNTETVLYSFCAMQNCTDGSSPHNLLVAKGKKLFGTTAYGGGPAGGGVAFEINR